MDIRTGPEGQYGVVIFPTGEECDEWDFYYGNCGLGYRKFPPEFVIWTGEKYFEKKPGIPPTVGVYRYWEDNKFVDVYVGYPYGAPPTMWSSKRSAMARRPISITLTI